MTSRTALQACLRVQSSGCMARCASSRHSTVHRQVLCRHRVHSLRLPVLDCGLLCMMLCNAAWHPVAVTQHVYVDCRLAGRSRRLSRSQRHVCAVPESQWACVLQVVIAPGAMLADRCVLLPGTRLAKNAIFGSGSLAPKGFTKCEAGDIWVGSADGSAQLVAQASSICYAQPAAAEQKRCGGLSRAQGLHQVRGRRHLGRQR